MPGPVRVPYTYDEVDSEVLPAAELVALWRETRGLPIAVSPSVMTTVTSAFAFASAG